MDKLLKKALSYYGQKELSGRSTNKIIIGWIKKYIPYVKNDEDYAWCSIFINEMAKECNLEFTDRTLARSWLDVGYTVNNPQIGDVVVFWRKKKESQWGHVGLYIREDDKYIYVLGGNQSNEVSIKPYPKYRLLGYRKLREHGV